MTTGQRTLVIANGPGRGPRRRACAPRWLWLGHYSKGQLHCRYGVRSFTNLVVELGIILALLMGWQFTAAEFVGVPIMILVLAVLFGCLSAPGFIDAARPNGLAGSMEVMPPWTCPSSGRPILATAPFPLGFNSSPMCS